LRLLCLFVWLLVELVLDVDIMVELMEVGLICYYVMGGVEVDVDIVVVVVSGLFAVGEVVGGMYGFNWFGGNLLLDLLVFGRWVGVGVVVYVEELVGCCLVVYESDVDLVVRVVFVLFWFGEEVGENLYIIY